VNASDNFVFNITSWGLKHIVQNNTLRPYATQCSLPTEGTFLWSSIPALNWRWIVYPPQTEFLRSLIPALNRRWVVHHQQQAHFVELNTFAELAFGCEPQAEILMKYHTLR